MRVPAKDWRPAGWTPPQKATGMRAAADTTARNAIRTPQFWLLWVVLFTNVTAGIGILEQAAPMVQAFFSEIDPAAAAGFVGVLSLCNMAGRFVWSSTSDVIGRKPIYMVYLGVGLVAYLGVVLLGTSQVAVFVILTGIILSFYGGGFATIPAYLKDMFGGLQVGAIHGRLLTAWSAAGVAGPLIVNTLVDAGGGADAGADAYRLPLSVMVGVLAVGFVANALVRPVDPKFQEPPAGGSPSSSSSADRSTSEEVGSR